VRRLLFGCVVVVGLAACRRSLPHPPYAQHPSSALQPVTSPPPPARPETIPEQPSDDAVWLDGEWIPSGRRWSYRPGRWVVPPAGAVYCPWTITRGEEGVLYHASGTFRDAQGQELDEPPPLAGANTDAGPSVRTRRGGQ